jgi:hypothetical protein
METFKRISLLLIALYLLISSQIVSTNNVKAAILFKVIPLISGLILLLIWVMEYVL